MVEAVRAFLTANPEGVVGTSRPDGTARQSVTYFVLDGDTVQISTESKRAKARDVERTGRASLCVMGHAKPFPAVTVEGSARIRTEDIGPATARIMERDRVILEIDVEGVCGAGPARFATADGGEQLRLVDAPVRGLAELGVGAEDADDLARIAAQLRAIDVDVVLDGDRLRTADPGTGTPVVVSVAPPARSGARPPVPTNGPGRYDRVGARADAVFRDGPVQPRRLSHVVLGSTDVAASERFFLEGLGFKVSDRIPPVGSFLRCSTDHHNILIQAAPVTFLHHTSWLVDDVDEIGRGASRMLAADPARHVWGLGRHHVGSNFFWYLRDPAGNFAEYSTDLDVIVDDERCRPEDVTGMQSLVSWGPPVPPSFIAPDDLAELMAVGSA